MTFESLTLMPFCFEKSSVRKVIFIVQATFSSRYMLNSSPEVIQLCVLNSTEHEISNAH